MKVITKIKKPKFNPIHITIRIENERELCDLWHRLNVSAHVVNTHSLPDFIKHNAHNDTTLYSAVNSLVVKLDLLK